MKVIVMIWILLLTACGITAHRTNVVSDAAQECSKQAFRALQQDIHRAEAAFEPIGVAADQDPSEANTAAAASAAADVAIAHANLAEAEAECS